MVDGFGDGFRDFTVVVRRRLAQRALALVDLPRGVRKATAVLSLLSVTLFTVGGGIFVTAVLLHAVVQRLDLPPNLPYPSTSPAVLQVVRQSRQYPVVVLPRPTFAKAADRTLVHIGNPADPFVQADAVGFGALLARGVHSLLTAAFHEAVSRPGAQVISPPRIPVTGGE